LRLGFWCLIGILLLYAVFPFYYAIVTSLKPSSTLFEVSYWIDRPDFSNYAAVLHQPSFLKAIGNSLVVALCVVTLALFLSLTAAYALGRVKFRGRGTVLMMVLGVSMFPGRGTVGAVRSDPRPGPVQHVLGVDPELHDFHPCPSPSGC